MPTSMEMPPMKIGHDETPSPYTPHGIKGGGEGGRMMAPAAINVAVNDALAPLGVRVTELPITPTRLLEAIARRGSASAPMAGDGVAGPASRSSPAAHRGLGPRRSPSHLGRTGFAVAVTARDLAAADGPSRRGRGRGRRRPRRSASTSPTRRRWRALAAARRGAGGRVHTVVANAGIAGPTARCTRSASRTGAATAATDLDGVFLTFRAFIPALIAAGEGSLIAVSSMTGKRPLHGRTPYAAAKMGVIGLVRTLATELGRTGCGSTPSAPAAIAGERIDAVIARQAASARHRRGRGPRRRSPRASPLDRLVTARGGRRRVRLPRLRPSASITGEDLNVSAGVVMY